ncbi:MAG: hypothetical protein AB7P40_15540 [Chloroflexota bacterium]
MITKHQMLEAIRSLPEDATVDDAVERLRFIELIEQRIADAEANPGNVLTQEEVERRISAWQQ